MIITTEDKIRAAQARIGAFEAQLVLLRSAEFRAYVDGRRSDLFHVEQRLHSGDLERYQLGYAQGMHYVLSDLYLDEEGIRRRMEPELQGLQALHEQAAREHAYRERKPQERPDRDRPTPPGYDDGRSNLIPR